MIRRRPAPAPALAPDRSAPEEGGLPLVFIYVASGRTATWDWTPGDLLLTDARLCRPAPASASRCTGWYGALDDVSTSPDARADLGVMWCDLVGALVGSGVADGCRLEPG